MPRLERARTALAFALVVAAVQAACLLAFWALDLAHGTEHVLPGAGVRPAYRLASLGLFLAVPIFLHDGPVGRRWPPQASRQATIIFSIAGLVAGFVVGGLLAEHGYATSWTLASRAGAVTGSFAALSLLNLFSSGS